LVLTETWLAFKDVFAESHFESGSNTPVDGEVEGSVDNL
jgi:hypothetical protein